MQVRKFEAKSMQEALSMVKRELGPEAIILSAKDNGQSFGLMGDASVEITAAISEKMLKKKHLAEKKMRAEDRERFIESPAPIQKKFINKVYDRTIAKAQPAVAKSTSRRYIEIGDEDEVRAAPTPIPAPVHKMPEITAPPAIPTPARVPQRGSASDAEVASLKKEISRLKKVIADFKTMPQSFISVHPGAEKGISFEFSAIYEKLQSVGVDEEIIARLISEAKESLSEQELKNKNIIDAWIARQILETTQVVEEPSEGKVHIFVGASGQGKTSSLVKMAGQMVVNQSKKIALISADTMKVGAADQLKIFAQILNVPFATVRGPQDWFHIMRELGDFDHLLLDFPAVQFREISDIDFVRRLLPPEEVSRKTHLVVSSTAKNKDVEEMARGFRILNFDDVIFTKLDESLQHGAVYNFQRKFSTPIHSFGTGPKIPEDFELATKERVLDLLFRLTKVNSERGIS